MIRRLSVTGPCLLCFWPSSAIAKGKTPSDPLLNAISPIGISICLAGPPTEAIPFFQACGCNTYQPWDLGWGRWPIRLDQCYADAAANFQQMENARFQTNVPGRPRLGLSPTKNEV